MKLKIKFQWDGYNWDWFIIPTIFIAARQSYHYPAKYGFGFGLLFLKAQIQVFVLINLKTQ